jgi:hypothetical protein
VTPTVQTPAKVALVTPPKAAQPLPSKKPHPSDVIRSQEPVFQDGNGYNIAATSAEGPVQATTSVRGFSLFARRENRNALRGAQDIHPADLIKSQRAASTNQGAALTSPTVRVVDPIHQLVVYPVVIDADITARGNAQMAMVWSNTVPMTLVQKGSVRLASYQ